MPPSRISRRHSSGGSSRENAVIALPPMHSGPTSSPASQPHRATGRVTRPPDEGLVPPAVVGTYDSRRRGHRPSSHAVHEDTVSRDEPDARPPRTPGPGRRLRLQADSLRWRNSLTMSAPRTSRDTAVRGPDSVPVRRRWGARIEGCLTCGDAWGWLPGQESNLRR
jgi:hypothetical protein